MHNVIHFVLGKANPNRMNGVNKSAHNLAIHQSLLGVKAEIWGITKDVKAYTPERPYPLRLFKTSKIRFYLDPKIQTALDEIEQPATFHFHGVLMPEFYAITKLLEKKGFNWVISPRSAYNPIIMHKRRWIKTPYFRIFEIPMLNGALAIHALTNQEKCWINDLFPNDKTVIIPNGENPEAFYIDREDLSAKGGFTIGFCGRIDEYVKGLDILLEGFSIFLESGNSGRLWLIGDGPSRSKLEQYCIEKNIKDHVDFFGPLYGEEKLKQIANMSIFAHCSRSEGIANSILEAAALKKALLVSEETNMGDDVRIWEAGITLHENNPQAVAEALFEMSKLSEETVEKLGGNAHRMIVEKYNYSSIAKSFIDSAYLITS